MARESKPPRRRLNVLKKADELLELLAENPNLTIAQLAEQSGEPRTSVRRLVATLEQMEFVATQRSPSTYQLGMQLYRLGNVVSSRFEIRHAALGAMKRVFERTGETVFLMVRHRGAAVCIERIDGRRVKAMAVEIGGSLPLHLGAGPLVLLAHAEADLIDDHLAGSLDGLTQHSVTDPDRIHRHLAEIRDRGYAISDEDLVLGIAALGVPIRDPSGVVVAALSLSGARPSILADNLADNVGLLRDAASSVDLSQDQADPSE